MGEPNREPQRPRPLATTTLVDRAAAGDQVAVETLCARLLPYLNAWTHGRLRGPARGLRVTGDVVHEALERSLQKLPKFRGQDGQSFLAYVLQAIVNAVRTEIGNVRPLDPLDHEMPDPAPSPLDLVLKRESEDLYRAALARLSADDQEVLHARLELQMTGAELALHIDRPSAAAARMAALRAMRRLATAMQALQQDRRT